MSDPLDRLVEEFSDVTAKAHVERPNIVARRQPSWVGALAASLVVLVLAGVAFVVLKSPSPTPASVAAISPSPSSVASHGALSIENRGGPTLIVAIDGSTIATVKCNGSTEIEPGDGGAPDLPWDLTIKNSNDGATLWSERIDGLPRWYLQIGESAAGLSTNPFAGPPGPSCRSTGPSASPTTDPPPEWHEPSAYSFTLESQCGERALIGRFQVVVEGGSTVQVTAISGYYGSEPLPPSAVPTLADLLDLAADARKQNADEVTEVLDPIDGHPLSVSVDRSLNTIDDEECYEITDYNPGSAPSVDAETGEIRVIAQG